VFHRLREGEATQERHRSKRHDKGCECEISAQDAVDEATDRACAHASKDSDRGRNPSHCEEHRDHPRNRDDRSVRKVNSSCQDDERHAGSKDGVDGDRARNVKEIVNAIEVWRDKRHENDQRKKDYQDTGAVPPLGEIEWLAVARVLRRCVW